MQQQTQQNQFQQNYLAKYMSFYYNKPVDYIQRLLATDQNGHVPSFNADTNPFLLAEAEKFSANFTNMQQKGQQKNVAANTLRYHPYKSSSKQPGITVITNSGSNCDLSPSMSLSAANSPTAFTSGESETHLKKLSSLNKQINRPMLSRSPSPAPSHSSLSLSSPIQKASNSNRNRGKG